jgi:hypothetical protein
MGKTSPYIGKGPEVDKAWHALSYDSMLSEVLSEIWSIANKPKLEIK